MVGRLLKDEKEILQEFKIMKTDRELTHQFLKKLSICIIKFLGYLVGKTFHFFCFSKYLQKTTKNYF